MLFGKAFGGFDVYGDVKVAARFAVKLGNALSANREGRAALGSLGNRKLAHAVGCGNGYLRAERRICKGNRKLIADVISLADEKLVSADVDLNKKVARRSAVKSGIALTLKRNALTVVNACRNVDLERFILANGAVSVPVKANSIAAIKLVK